MTPWQRTYWVVFVANLVTAIGMMSFLPFFPGILEELGVTDVEERMLWTGVLFGAAPLAASVMGPVWGSLGDRFGRKLMVIRALLAIAVFVGAMGLATHPVELLALRLAQGCFSGFIPPSITLVSVSTPRELQGRVTGSLQAALPAGMIAGPLVGEWLFSRFGTDGLFAFVACAAGTSAFLVALFASEDASLRITVERFSPVSVLSSTIDDLRKLMANVRIRRAIYLLFAIQFGVGATNPLLQLFVEDIVGGSSDQASQWTAYLFSAFAVAALVASPIWGRVCDRIGHGRALAIAAVATALLLGLQAFVTAFLVLLVLRVLLGLITPGANISSFGLAATETSEENRGGAFGAVFSARTFAVSVGSVAGGAISAAIGVRGLFVASGLVVAFAIVVLRPWAGERSEATAG